MVINAVIKKFRVVLEGKGINIESESIDIKDIEKLYKIGLIFLSQDIKTRLNTYCTINIKAEYDMEVRMFSEAIFSNEMKYNYRQLKDMIGSEITFNYNQDIY